MRLQQIIKEKNALIGVWEITESLEELINLLPDISVSNYKHIKRKKEFLATRLLLNHLDIKETIVYNNNCAPELNSGMHISISHSKNLVAIILSTKKVGIDIENISKKAKNLSSKFICTESHPNLTKEQATLIWCCKEAIYKWHQKGNINFIKDIKVTNIHSKYTIEAYFKNKKIILNYHKIKNHYLVYLCR